MYMRVIVAAQSASHRGFVSIHAAVQYKDVGVCYVESKRAVFISCAARSPKSVGTRDSGGAVLRGSNWAFIVASADAQRQPFYFFRIVMNSERYARSIFPV